MNYFKRTYSQTDCDREPIHILGDIQSFGALISTNVNLEVLNYSANAANMLGAGNGIAAGMSLTELVQKDAFNRLRDAASKLPSGDVIDRLFSVELQPGRKFDCALHRSADALVFEFEPHPAEAKDNPLDLLGPLAQQLEQADSIQAICTTGADKLKSILGFDRVMVYRFHHDGSGEVVAEKQEPHLESFFGLRFPRTDVPDQARELYLRNRFRIIADAGSEPVPILPEPDHGEEPIDLSMSTLRSVSPIHIQYLRNMGVAASLSISIVHQGKLWGLFACHHYSPKTLPFAVRTTAELFSQLFSIALDRSLMREAAKVQEKGQKLHDKLVRNLSESRSILSNLPLLNELTSDAIRHDGISIFADETYRTYGAAPTREEFEAILPALEAAPANSVIATEALAQHVSLAKPFADKVAGAMILPVSRAQRDYLVLWRKELPQKVVWAGNPHKVTEAASKAETLTPRTSFAAWEEQLSGRSAPWTSEEVQIAENLRTTLIEVILRLTDETEQERRKAQEHQNLLIAELNHRVRNVLNLIRSLIDQSRHEALDISQFTEIIGGRISALASAHDNITRENWSPAAVSKLIEAEAKAYLSSKGERVRMKGNDALVSPEAYTVLALVIHEMITNSAKHGSLCDRRGELDIELSRSDEDDLLIEWRERGGPPVKTPTSRGFGSTIIERSIPFELNGEAKLDFKPTGLEALFRIPAKFVSEISDDAAAGSSSENERDFRSEPHDGDAPGHVLLVEDSMIIALDTAESLKSLGVGRVTTAANTGRALEAIETDQPDFAIVDFNLGSESSEEVIHELRRRGIPFVLATGYNKFEEELTEIGARGIIRKPYGTAELKSNVPGLQ